MFKFDNNVLSSLASAVSIGATSISVAAESGINKPPPDPNGGTGVLTLVDDLANPQKMEIIYYTGRTGTGPYTLTGVSRGQEGTSDQSWNAGDYVFQDVTVGSANMGIMNLQTISNDLVVPAGYNALLIGPVTVASGKTVSAESGGNLYIGPISGA